MTPTFYLTHSGAVTYGAPPDGATVIPYEGAAPFSGRVVLAAALTVVLRLQAEWSRTRRDDEPAGRWANLRGANLRGADLSGANLSGANLSGADLRGADLRWVALREANLSGANLSGADLRGANLRGADLRGADLSGADLRWVDLSGADLRGADLRWVALREAVGVATPEEEEATLSAAIDAIAREPALWNQGLWHEVGYSPIEAPEVGACGSAHCLAGWMQAQLPLGHELRKVEAQWAGTILAPRAAAAGWFDSETHPDLQARVDAAKAKLEVTRG